MPLEHTWNFKPVLLNSILPASMYKLLRSYFALHTTLFMFHGVAALPVRATGLDTEEILTSTNFHATDLQATDSQVTELNEIEAVVDNALALETATPLVLEQWTDNAPAKVAAISAQQIAAETEAFLPIRYTATGEIVEAEAVTHLPLPIAEPLPVRSQPAVDRLMAGGLLIAETTSGDRDAVAVSDEGWLGDIDTVRVDGDSLESGALEPDRSMEQVTSVAELADVQPTDWAFQALQSLVERYGAIAGYPEGLFQGNRSLSRYEFAGALQIAIARLEDLLAANTADSISKADLLALQRLQEDFAAELASLQGKADVLEARTAELEANQFSTTTKLTGEISFALVQALGGTAETNTVLQQRNQLFFNTSFTGHDLLVLVLQGGTAPNPDLPGNSDEGLLAHQIFGNTNSDLFHGIGYIFPLSKKLQGILAIRSAFFSFYTPTLNPLLEDADRANGALSAFAQSNSIYRLGGGAGLGFNYAVTKSLLLSTSYLASERNNAASGSGLFNGDYSILAQLTVNPRQPISIAFTYLNSYFGAGRFAYGRGSSLSLTGTRVANTLNGLRATTPIAANSYGMEATWRLNPKVTLSGWVGLTKARLLGKGDAEIWNYAVTLALPDLGKEGNLGGLVFGVEPTLRGLDVPDARPFKRDFAYHVEVFYKHQLNNNISLTPGFVWLLAPNQDASNSDVFIGVLRTTFSF